MALSASAPAATLEDDGHYSWSDFTVGELRSGVENRASLASPSRTRPPRSRAAELRTPGSC